MKRASARRIGSPRTRPAPCINSAGKLVRWSGAFHVDWRRRRRRQASRIAACACVFAATLTLVLAATRL
jgi:hypothetical protein